MPRPRKKLSDIAALVPIVYEAAIGERPWESVAAKIARAFESSSTTLQVLEQGRPYILDLTDNVKEHLKDYLAHYNKKDLWIERGISMVGLGNVAASKDMLTDAQFENSEFYQDWCKKMDVFYVVGSVFPVAPRELGVLGIHRARHAGTYQEEDKAFVRHFLPHFRRALEIRSRLRQAELTGRAALETLNRSGTAMLIVSRDARVLFATAEAETMLRIGNELYLRSGRLTASRPTDAAKLTGLIWRVSAPAFVCGHPGCPLVIKRGDTPSLSVLVAPFPRARAGEPVPGAIVLVHPHRVPITSVGVLRKLFGLTPAEARIANALAEGRSIPEMAVDYQVSPATLRKQLKLIFAKTGTNRQAQLVSTIWRSVLRSQVTHSSGP